MRRFAVAGSYLRPACAARKSLALFRMVCSVSTTTAHHQKERMAGMTETSADATANQLFTVPVICDAPDAFGVVIPSMPGYGCSGKPRDTGWDPWLAVSGQ